MNIIKERTRDLHEDLERLPFNQKMFRSEQTIPERIGYLLGLQSIFVCLDQYVPTELRRYDNIKNDIAKLKEMSGMTGDAVSQLLPWASIGYCTYLDYITDDIEPHVYLNYMGLMFGGQIMKKRYPQYPMSVYDFDDDLSKLKLWIREEVCEENDKFIDEVKMGFKWNMAMMEELGNEHDVE